MEIFLKRYSKELFLKLIDILTKRKILILRFEDKKISKAMSYFLLSVYCSNIAVLYAAMQMMTGRITTFDAIVSRT